MNPRGLHSSFDCDANYSVVDSHITHVWTDPANHTGKLKTERDALGTKRENAHGYHSVSEVQADGSSVNLDFMISKYSRQTSFYPIKGV